MVARFLVDNTDENTTENTPRHEEGVTTLAELFDDASEPADRSKLPKEQWEWITPAIAEQYLEFNEKNRKLRKETVEVYARDLRAGKWLISGDTIKFDSTGRLIDGQHRLKAILLANTATWGLVVRGVEPDVQRVLDTQARRSAADALRFAGIDKNAQLISGIARNALLYTDFMENKPSKPIFNVTSASHTEIQAWTLDHPEASEAAVMALALKKAGGHGLVSWGLSWIKLMSVDPVDARDFFNSLANFQTNGKGDPRHTLLTTTPGTKTRGRYALAEQLVAISTAWNAYRRQEELNFIKPRLNGRIRDIPVAV
jgi:hypothetical protein